MYKANGLLTCKFNLNVKTKITDFVVWEFFGKNLEDITSSL